MKQYYALITGDDNYFIIADGMYDFSTCCSQQSDGSYLFNKRYLAYKKGGTDTEKVYMDATTTLNPYDKKALPFTRCDYSYYSGCYNKSQLIYASVVPADAIYMNKEIMRYPSYKVGCVLLELEKTDEFIKLLNEFEEPQLDAWSIYDDDKCGMLSLAYLYGIGREKDEKKAAIYAFKSTNKSAVSLFIEKGFGKNVIKSVKYYLKSIDSNDNNVGYYLLANALIDEGYVKAGESMIMWGANCHSPENDYAFYNDSNKAAWKWQALLLKQKAQIDLSNNKDISSIASDYGYYLNYNKYGDFKNYYITTSKNLGDMYESDWQTVIEPNKNLINELLEEASNNGDEFAKEILKRQNNK